MLSFALAFLTMLVLAGAGLGGGVSGKDAVFLNILIILTAGSFVSAIVSFFSTPRHEQSGQASSEKQLKSRRRVRIVLITSIIFVGSVFLLLYGSAYFVRMR